MAHTCAGSFQIIHKGRWEDKDNPQRPLGGLGLWDQGTKNRQVQVAWPGYLRETTPVRETISCMLNNYLPLHAPPPQGHGLLHRQSSPEMPHRPNSGAALDAARHPGLTYSCKPRPPWDMLLYWVPSLQMWSRIFPATVPLWKETWTMPTCLV